MPLGTLARPGSTFDDPASFRPLADAMPGGSDPVGAPGVTWTARASIRPCCTRRSGCTSPSWRIRLPRSPSPPPTTTGSRATVPPIPAASSGRPCCRCRIRPPRRASSGGRSASSATWRGSSGPTPAWDAPFPTRPTSRCGMWPRSSRCLSASTRAVQSVFRRSGRTARSTRSCSTRRPTRSRRCSPAPSSSHSGRSSTTRDCGFSSWNPPEGGLLSGSNAWTNRRSPSAGFAPTWRSALRSTSPGSAPSASRSTNTRCPHWRPSSARTASSGAATTRTMTPPFQARSTPSAPPWPPASPQCRCTCSGSTLAASTGFPRAVPGCPGSIDDYFTAVTAQEIDLVRALFTPDAVFESGDIRLQGLDAISGYYTSKTFTFDDFRPVPGVPNFDGTRVHVDIDVRPGRRAELGARPVRDGRHAHHRAPGQRIRRGPPQQRER